MPTQEPRLLGRYALYEKIASGGMASVHIGRLLGPVGFARTVAIKRMHPQFAEDPEFAAMFLDEARLAARIRHPNVVPTLDVVTIEGELFLVMEYVEGESLARLGRMASARGERIPPAMTATLMVGVLHGLHAAHEAKNDRGEPLGIVHRDVTPQNVLVGSDGVARVLDFGVAKAIGRAQTTRQGQLKGKLSYMAPEQLKGIVSRSTDVYAASVVLWEALAGRRLFSGDGEGEIFTRVLAGATEPPSQHALDISPELDAVTMRGLRLEPGERFATAREMARALENAAPLVATSVIGEWVETVARDSLDERSARIAAIETGSSLHAPDAEPPPPAAEAAPPKPPGVAIVVDEADPTQVSSGSVSAPGQEPAPVDVRRGGRRAIAAGVGVGLAVIGVAAALWSPRATPKGGATTPGEPSVSSPASPPPMASETPPVREPSPAASVSTVLAPTEPPIPIPAPAAASSSPAAPATAKAPAHALPMVGSPPPHGTASAATSCHPPYYFDSRGVRVFKPECL